jgi:putative transposase
MPEYRRARSPGTTFFFTVNTHLRQPFLIDVDVRAALREGIDRVRLTMPFEIDAWVLLPDHLHCIWTLPDGDADFSSRWRIIKTIVTQRCGSRLNVGELLSDRRKRKNQSSLWQQRFWEHQIRDDADFIRHVDYIHWNPVKHGHAKRAGDWPYSSLHRYVRNGLLPTNWLGVNADQYLGKDFGE